MTRKQMPKLPVGELDPDSPAQATRDLIESIPIEMRISRIDEFLYNRRGSSADFDADAMDTYQYLLHKSIKIDPGVLRILMRYATRSLLGSPVNEKQIRSASDIVNHIQRMFRDGTFDYMTPEYILDWYAAMTHVDFRVRGNRLVHLSSVAQSHATTIFGDNPDMSLDVMAEIRRYMLELRRDRLVRTGYELC
jgi:hypothetical protein